MSSPEGRAGAGGSRASLRDVARDAIARGVREGREPRPDPREFPPALREPGASFVTLRHRGELRGCTGTLVPALPLVCDVARNAWRSAFHDPRFTPLGEGELALLEVSVTVLSALETLCAASEDELLSALRPGVDGLVLVEEDGRAATFLPAVWEGLPEPREFLERLRAKAGLAPGYWSPTLRFRRYTASDAG